MAGLKTLLPLVVCLSLGQRSLAKNEEPCQPSKWNNAFSTFIRRHVRADMPSSLNKEDWEKYIRQIGGCENRPTQSFLHQRDLERVKAVCSSHGGKTFKENLCISQEAFSFVTVRSEPGTCGLKSVHADNKHLILACEALENQCLPVHFEGNSQNAKPDNNARACVDPQKAKASAAAEVTWVSLLLSVLVAIICGQQAFPF
ncbi:uncharacterized protein LOC130132467 [Lampris incognitus]|uniref:uncharacterized protein LOC130132467 n=1 Tax=Lampris incognitus TaxID=2546036 RepID=UPI0024B4F7D2|nr:uncharacterized protein LOC130132467 [Lampris incognitus]